MTFPKTADKHIPYCADQGLKHLVGATKPGVSIQTLKKTQSGAAPLVVDLEAEGLETMADANYVVLTGGETAARTTVDESTITKTGFNVLGGANAEVHHLVIIGRVKGQAA